MTLPVRITLGDFELPLHALFEVLAYVCALLVFLRLRRREADVLTPQQRLYMSIAVLFGAGFGSKLLALLENPEAFAAADDQLFYFLANKTNVGALWGGFLTVEALKKVMGVRARTGDILVVPVLAGLAVGRVGCFLAGLDDGTHGVPSALPWAFAIGDGIPRHPVMLYELLWLGAMYLGARHLALRGRPWPQGLKFDLFMIGYFTCRVLVDQLKEAPWRPGGLSPLQWAALAGVVVFAARALWMRTESHAHA